MRASWLIGLGLVACDPAPGPGGPDAAIDGPEGIDAPIDAAGIDPPLPIDAPGVIDAAPVACQTRATFAYALPAQSPGTTVWARTDAGWLVAYVAGTEIWWTAVSAAGVVTAGPALVEAGFAPRLAVNGDRALLVYRTQTEARALRLTSAGAAIGGPVTLVRPLAAATAGGVVADAGAGFVVQWYETIPVMFPDRPHESRVAIAHVDRDGVVLATGPTTRIEGITFDATVRLPDGALGAVVQYRRAVGGCFACSSDGFARFGSDEVPVALGAVAVDAQRFARVRSIAAPAPAYAVRIAMSPEGAVPPYGAIARWPLDDVLMLPNTEIGGIATTTAGAGAFAYGDGTGAWLEAFTDDGTAFTRGARCTLARAPTVVARAADDAVLLLGGGAGAIVTTP